MTEQLLIRSYLASNVSRDYARELITAIRMSGLLAGQGSESADASNNRLLCLVREMGTYPHEVADVVWVHRSLQTGLRDRLRNFALGFMFGWTANFSLTEK